MYCGGSRSDRCLICNVLWSQRHDPRCKYDDAGTRRLNARHRAEHPELYPANKGSV